ncbi:MAG: tetratricopeptide repeat protein, partial [Chloroflexi bacterium]|nr:tetratricopeptide repeat protein [Chloroflexota bacterium]
LYARQREEAAQMLLRAYETTRSTDAMLLREAARQMMIAAQVSPADRQPGLATRAVEFAHEAAHVHRGPSSTALLAETAWLLALITGDETHKQVAIEAAAALTDQDPHGIGPWRRLGDLYRELGMPDEAASAYQRALQNNANFELDPMRQLSERDRRELEERAIRDH